MSDRSTPSTTASPGPSAAEMQSARRLPPPIGRGPRAQERVLRAALELLAEQGLTGFSMEAVARRAGASKNTLYRRWPSQDQLLVDAMDASFQPLSLPSTGQLRADLIAMHLAFASMLGGQLFPRLMAAFMDAAERNPALSKLHFQLTERRRDPVRQLLTQAVERGEIPPTADLELAIDLLAGPAFYRRFLAHREIPHDYASSVVDHVLRAIGYAEEGEVRR